MFIHVEFVLSGSVRSDKGAAVAPKVIGAVDRNQECQLMYFYQAEYCYFLARRNGTVEKRSLDEQFEDPVLETFHLGSAVDADQKISVKFVGLDITKTKDGNELLLACTADGQFISWSLDTCEIVHQLSFGPDLRRMRAHPNCPGIFAIGGKERDLTIFDLSQYESGKKLDPVFKAKNVKHDKLDLRVAVDIYDFHFISGDYWNQVIVATGLKELRIYDTSKARRPISSRVVGEHGIRRIFRVPNRPHEILLTDCTTNLFHYDFQKSKMLGRFSAFAGTVTDVFCSDGKVISVSLDRNVRVHDLKSRELIHKVYAKQLFSCVMALTDEEKNGNSSEDDHIWDQLDIVEDGKASNSKPKRRKLE